LLRFRFHVISPRNPRGFSHVRRLMPTVILDEHATVTEIDEALTYARRLPANQRGAGWHAFVDKLLEMRAAQTDKHGGSIPTFSEGK
jgi:hypothetical protein